MSSMEHILLTLGLEAILFMLYITVVIPIHEVGHMIAFRHYGAKSIIRLGSSTKGINVDREASLAYCELLLWADVLPFMENERKDVTLSFAGAGASIIFCLCMYIIFPLSALLFVALFEGFCGLLEVKEGQIENERIRQGHFEGFWWIEDKEGHEIFIEEINKYEGEGMVTPFVRANIRCMGFDVKEFE